MHDRIDERLFYRVIYASLLVIGVKLIYDDKREMEAFTASPYHYEKQFEVAPGTYNLKVVFSSGANQLGRVDAPLKVEAWDAQAFSLSRLALSKPASVPQANTPWRKNRFETVPS